MLNVIATTTIDPDGYIELNVTDGLAVGDTSRRVNRVKTLDGGVAVNDFGYAEGDRTIDLRWTPLSRLVEDAVTRLVKLYSQVSISTRAGVFLAAPETYQPGATESRLRLLVLSKLSE